MGGGGPWEGLVGEFLGAIWDLRGEIPGWSHGWVTLGWGLSGSLGGSLMLSPPQGMLSPTTPAAPSPRATGTPAAAPAPAPWPTPGPGGTTTATMPT